MPSVLTPPVKPMLAKAAGSAIPDDADLIFEPKWDGFRCLVFRSGDEVTLQSRSSKPLNRYFPEVVARLTAGLPDGVVLDGELVVGVNGALNFDALSERIHPAASRVNLLAEQTPATFVAFDVLQLPSGEVLETPGISRRQMLVDLVSDTDAVSLTPATQDAALARQWFTLFEGAGLDGVIGKPAQGPYTPDKRTMLKFKHSRTADCVVAGLRWYKDTEPGTSVGSLLLGLYDDKGTLHSVGVVGSFPAERRRELAVELEPLMADGSVDHPWVGEIAPGTRVPGEINRWRSAQAAWVPLRRELVVEVAYEHTEGGYPSRFRHTAQFIRWRPDREPSSCGYEQLEEPARYDLDAVLKGEVRSR
ncbi:ATP-dependent DNA ligase [Actinocrispum sp. NPDC049592]|uniref:ATP-dependent DNA ligase n=1 Tax=Actinocrispum sp. NPDC049592 TaxID=3154835 RepID=UPI00342CB30A